MRFFTKILAACSLGLVMASAGAGPANPQDGVDYRTLPKPVATDSGKKVEVLEFFWYNCPHCNAFEPALADWAKKQGDNIVVKRVPVAFRDTFVPQQKLYYALEAMGKVEEMQKKIFRAIHTDRQQLDTEAQIVDFVTKQGIDKQKFLDLYNSFAVQTKTKRALQLQQDYRLEGVPAIGVAGRYLTSPSMMHESFAKSGAGNQAETVLHEATLKVVDWLIKSASK